MLITGIRHIISSELDIRRSAVFMRCLVHYLEMFAWLGIILPIFIGIDFFSKTLTKEETVTNKYYQIVDSQNQREYYFHTTSYQFLSDIIFYENTNISDRIILHRTPIFNIVTSVSHRVNNLVYKCKPNNIYSWPLIIVAMTFIFSVIMSIRTFSMIRKQEYIKYDAMINLGIINSIFCIFIIVATLFHIPN